MNRFQTLVSTLKVRPCIKIRVRALEAERALERVAVMQDVMLQTMVACAAVNMGVVLFVSGLLLQARLTL